LKKIVKFTGTPNEEAIKLMKSPFAAKMLENIPFCKCARLDEKFPDEEIDKLTMLDRLLRFSPNDRLSSVECLELKWMKAFHCEDDEPVASKPIIVPLDDNKRMTMETYRSALYRNIRKRRNKAKAKLARRRNGSRRHLSEPTNSSHY